jgi:hypothetical protein
MAECLSFEFWLVIADFRRSLTGTTQVKLFPAFIGSGG